MFRNFLKGLCFAIMLCGKIFESVNGMTVEDIHIYECEQFFQITPVQASSIKTIRIEDQEIDEDFCKRWTEILSKNEFNDIRFDSCHFSSGSLYILDGLTAMSLSIINSEITSKDACEILSYINPYSIKSMDFSSNRLGLDEETFERGLTNYVSSRMSLDAFILTGNGFSEAFISRIKTYGYNIRL